MIKNIKNLLILTAMALLGALSVQAANRMFVEDFSIAPGETKTIEFVLENDEALFGFEIHWKLPEGITYVRRSATEDETRSKYFDISTSFNDNEFICVAHEPQQTDPIEVGKGSIMSIQLKAADDFVGTYKTTITDLEIATTSLNGISLDDVPVTINPATPLATILAEGESGKTYTVAESLTIVDKQEKEQLLFATDGAGNWLKIQAGDYYVDAAAMQAIAGESLTGTYQVQNGNPSITLLKVPVADLDPMAVTPEVYNLADPFAPQPNEVITLVGVYYGDKMRGYAGGTAGSGQSADLNLAWSSNSPTLTQGKAYRIDRAVVQLHQAWDADDAAAGAPARMRADDPLAFQNYEIFPLAMPDVPTAIAEVEVEPSPAATHYIDMSGRRYEERPATAGIYVKVAGDKATKVVVK